MALGSPTQDITTLVVKIQYPSICAFYDLDSLLEELNAVYKLYSVSNVLSFLINV